MVAGPMASGAALQEARTVTPFDPGSGLRLAIALRVAVVALTLLSARRSSACRWVGFAGSALASIVTAATAAAMLSAEAGISSHGELFLHRASGFSFTYAADGLSAWFLIVLSTLSIPIAIFSIGYFAHGPLARRTAFSAAGFNALVGAVELVFVAGDAITFLFAWELMTLAAVALVTTEHEEGDHRRAAFLYLVLSHLGTGCLIAGFFALASMSGSVSFATLLSGEVARGPMRDGLFALFFIGFGIKAGIVPLHVWLPEAHPAAPSSISALMSGVLLKAGIYGIVRVCAFGLGTPSLSWGVIVIALGGLSAVLGVLYALMQHDIKRLLAYHSIENIGIILLGLGAGMVALSYGRGEIAWIGVAASLYHVLNHAVFKGLLFLGAGTVVMATGTRQIEQFGGLLRRMPWTGLCFLIGAMAISALPPLNGFASEWLTFQAFLFGFRESPEPLAHFLFPVGGAVLALTTALAAACFVKAFGISFLALPRTAAAAGAREAPPIMLIPQALLAALCLGLGLFPGGVLKALGRVLVSLPGLPPQADAAWNGLGMATGGAAFDYVVPMVFAAALACGIGVAAALSARSGVSARRAPTWGCGGELSPQTEYTATAFSKPLMMIFQAIYRPTRRVESLGDVSPYFPQGVRYHSEIEPTFERHVYGPVLRGVLRVADSLKVIQAGSLHAYLGYVIALVVWLMLVVWWRA
ncbi:MAG: hydrogenase 4 subunit B [Vicinamibacteria bacterium]|nr:hydrogenase 4 subunit B [Vicinamibacteria bacterium]